MTRNSALREEASRPTPELPLHLAGRSIVLIGLMGAGKTSIGRRLAARLGMPFRDADAEIELAAGRTIPELFAHFGEREFRDGERRVIRRLLEGEPLVLATGGGSFVDPDTRAAVRRHGVSIWLRCSLGTLVRRVAGRSHRPLLREGNAAETLARLMQQRDPFYAEADLVIDCSDEPPEITTDHVATALAVWRPPQRVPVALGARGYDVVIGDGLLSRAGALLAPVLPHRRVVIVSDEVVAPLHLAALQDGLAATGIDSVACIVPTGESAKSLSAYGDLVDALLDRGIERRTAIVALGGGVVGDLAGFAAATVLRGVPFVQIPTTLLAQVDSSVGGKTGINTRHGKNLLGAFHQPQIVLADTATLATLPPRELRAGYAEIVKAGLIGDAAFFAWCEANGAAVCAGAPDVLAEAVAAACAFKARVVGDDEREERANDGRALLNLGHTFGHALEAELGYGTILHGEAVAIGLCLAADLSARLGLIEPADAARIAAHLQVVDLPTDLRALNRRVAAEALLRHMQRDKKNRDGRLRFVLMRGIGQAFTSSDVDESDLSAALAEAGAA
ncbi:MAG TPA: 3-dehydroquinate synthase [Acetobacteraceae bacterium]|nr:3-dehydroquinate synthase [Acetobacteraceae bacterium]